MSTVKESDELEHEAMVANGDVKDPDVDGIDTRCGLGGCKPKWLQKFGTIQSFVGFGSLSNFLMLSLKMYFISQITTLEKRFGFSSSQSGLILSSSQIGFLLVVLFVSHYGRNSHIPKILSAAAFIVGITGLVFGVAHLLPMTAVKLSGFGNQTFSNGTISKASKELCQKTTGNISLLESRCEDQTESSSYSGSVAMGIFLVAMLFQGAASAPRSPLGGTYVDDNNPVPTRSGKYVGIMTGIYTLAPILAYGIGSAASRLYHTLQPTDLTPRDPRWIGAWWLGFGVFGLLTCLSAIVLLCFPRRLKSAYLKPKRETDSEILVVKNISACERVKGPFEGAIRLIKNPIFTTIALCGTFQVCALMGTASFLTKYMETQFYVPAYKANLILGAISLFGSSTGPIVGGLVTSRFKLKTSGNLHLILVVSLLLTLGCPVGMLLAGTQTNVVKNNLPGFSSTNGAGIQSCVSQCVCEKNEFRPVCGGNDVTFFSPCDAGCSGKENRTYTGCSCAAETFASPGYCAKEDSKVYILLLYMTLNSFAITLTISPAFLIFVRNVSAKDKALAIGLPSFMTTVLGHFPGPIIYGLIVDSSCQLWRTTCSGRGACDLYNIDDFRIRMFGTNMALFFLATLCVFIAVVVFKQKGSKAEIEELEKKKEHLVGSKL